MISSKNLLLTVSPQTTPKASTTSNSLEDSLDLTVKDKDDKKDDKDNSSTVDQSSFVTLLSQLSNSPTPEPAANESDSTSDSQNALVSELSNQQVTQDSQQTVDTANLLATPTTGDSKAQTVNTDNPALNWLDSENFKNLKSSGDTANSDTTSKLQANLSTALNSSLAQPAPAPVDVSSTPTNVGNSNTQPSIQELNSSLSQLDNLVAAAVGTKSDSKPDELVNLPTGATAVAAPMAMVTNQPSHLIGQPKSLDIPVPVTHTQWGDQFAEHIAWLGKNDVKSAVIKLNPEELGPIEISVKVVKDTASVNIVSHSAQVRDVMDQAIPKLRDMMSAEGLNLSDVQISADQRSGNAFAQNNNNNQQANDGTVFTEGDEEVQMVSSVKKPPKGLVDYFA